MNRIAQFFKVSLDEYLRDGSREEFESISLPRRATKGSAGYDFYAPKDIFLASEETVKVATGIRVKIDEGWVLKIYPRSSLGFKYRLTLNNTVGIIDSDYYYADNEGHIFIKMTNLGKEPLSIKKGSAFAQGVFVEYGITLDDEPVTDLRKGGFGSTDKKV